VFSPYYARARARGAAPAEEHCALNVALYGPQRHWWSMTERGRGALARSADALQIGPSMVALRGDCLEIAFREIAVPLPRRLRGRIRVHLRQPAHDPFVLDGEGVHRWRPIAPQARVEVDCDAPSLRWQGHGYVDSNVGEAPLEDHFASWHWSRARLPGDAACVLYDVQRRDGSTLALALRFGRDGRAERVDPPPWAPLPASRWRLSRLTRNDPGSAPRLLGTWEDGPFYARSLVGARWLGEPVQAVHESLSLDRFRARWVRALLPFRMPRAAR
jgi:carotenoid 1,2-hydratase